jgi:Thioredoxin
VSSILARLAVVAVVALLIWLGIAVARRAVDRRRRLALATAAPLPGISTLPVPVGHGDADNSDNAQRPVRILAFSSDDCAQCHRLQAPALRRVLEARADTIAVVEIDAPSAPELTSRYRVLTLPTTVVLDAEGRARAINYGFANSEHLLAQVDALLDPAAGTAAWTA